MNYDVFQLFCILDPKDRMFYNYLETIYAAIDKSKLKVFWHMIGNPQKKIILYLRRFQDGNWIFDFSFRFACDPYISNLSYETFQVDIIVLMTILKDLIRFKKLSHYKSDSND